MMVKILVRTISPKKKPFDYSYFKREIQDEIRMKKKPEVIALFEQTVKGWRNKPEFRSRLFVRPDSINLFVSAAGPHADQYNLVDAGARPHPITPRGGGTLKFRSEYRPATKPRVIGSRPARRGGPWRIVKEIKWHPGFEGRDFYSTIAKAYKDEYNRNIKNALQRATRRMARASNP